MTLAGVYSGRSRNAPGDTHRLAEAAGARDGRYLALSDGPLVAVRGDGSGAAAGERDGVSALLCGSLHRPDDLGRELGADPGAGPELLLAAAYRRWGVEMLDRLRGDFSLLVWDRRSRTGLLAQDHLGVQAVFYARRGDALVFASEVRSLLGLLPSTPGPDRQALVQWLAGSRTTGERTLYEGVQRLRGGHALLLEGGRWRRTCYWRAQYRPPRPRPHAELVAGLREAVVRAVRDRTGAPERPGLIISGGIDSSMVATAARHAADAGGPLPLTYSAVFPGDDSVDESASVRALTEALRLPNRSAAIPRRGALALSFEYLAAWRMPLPGPGYMIEYPLLRWAAEDGVTVVLDGQGGDEVFGTAPYVLADCLRRGRLDRALRLARRLPGAGDSPSRRSLRRALRYYGVDGLIPHRLHRWRQMLRGPRRHSPAYLSDSNARLFCELDDPWAWKRRSGPRWWAYLADLLTTSREENSLCDYLRHRAAHVGLSARPPLFDVDLVEFVLGLPPEAVLNPHFDRYLARASMEELVPDSVRLSTSKSNLAPVYLASLAGPDLGVIRRLLAPETAEVMAHVRPEEVRRMIDRPPSVGDPGWLDWILPVWCLATAECWLRTLGDPAFPTEAPATLGVIGPNE